MSTTEKSTAWDFCEAVFNTLNHVMIGMITIYVSFFCVKRGMSGVTAQHALICTLGVK